MVSFKYILFLTASIIVVVFNVKKINAGE